jgi:hypothetical protein
MSFELWNTFATFGTFLVISATAIAAIVQLRHLRGSNQIAAINELRETHETPAFAAARYFILVELNTLMEDPAFRYQIADRASGTGEMQAAIQKAVAVGNFYEGMGVLVEAGLVDRELALKIWSGIVTTAWEKLAPVTAIFRRKEGSGLWDNFEHLTMLSREWIAAHPNGTYPPGAPRIELKDKWLEADTEYAVSSQGSRTS